MLMLNVRLAFRQGLFNTNLLSPVGNAFLELRGLNTNNPVIVSLFEVQVGGLATYNTLQNRGYIRITPFPVFQFILRTPQELGFSNPDRIKDARSVDGDYLYLLRALQNEFQETELDVVLATPEFRAKWEFTDDDFLAAILRVANQPNFVVQRVEIPAVGQTRFNQMLVAFTPQSQAFNTAALTEAQIKQLFSDRLLSPTSYAFMALQFDGVREVVPTDFYSKWGITPSALLAAIAALNENLFIRSFQGGTINLTYPANVVIPAIANPVLSQAGQLYQQLGRVESIQTDNFAGLEPSVLFRSLNQLQNAGLVAFQAGEIRLTWAERFIPENPPT